MSYETELIEKYGQYVFGKWILGCFSNEKLNQVQRWISMTYK